MSVTVIYLDFIHNKLVTVKAEARAEQPYAPIRFKHYAKYTTKQI